MKSSFTKADIYSLIRHGATFIGGFLVAQGKADFTDVESITGGVLALIGAIWAYVNKRKGIPDPEVPAEPKA